MDWTDLICKCGFAVLDASHCVDPHEANKLFTAVDFNRPKSDGFIPNVIKAYYATYVPIPFVFKKPVQSHSIAPPVQVSESARKRSRPVTVWESKKHPGNFYILNETNGDPVWVKLSSDGSSCTDIKTKSCYDIEEIHRLTS